MDRLQAVNALRNYSIDENFDDELCKAAYSVLLQVFNKLSQKEMSKRIKPPKKKKEFTISLQPYEAWFLEKHIRYALSCDGHRASFIGVAAIADQINQKLA